MRKIDFLVLRFFSQDRHLRFEVGRLDVGDESPFEPRSQALLERRNVFRRSVGGEHDLFLRLVECVEGVKELFLRPLFAGKELNVVEQKRIDGAISISELLHLVVADRSDELGHERIGRHVDDFQSRI